METTKLQHKHGGKIISIDAIEHETYKGVATWHYCGKVEWQDGTVSEQAHIYPWDVCFDHDDVEACAEYDKFNTALSEYLDENGAWREKHHRDGRISSWQADKKTGRREFT